MELRIENKEFTEEVLKFFSDFHIFISISINISKSSLSKKEKSN